MYHGKHFGKLCYLHLTRDLIKLFFQVVDKKSTENTLQECTENVREIIVSSILVGKCKSRWPGRHVGGTVQCENRESLKEGVEKVGSFYEVVNNFRN